MSDVTDRLIAVLQRLTAAVGDLDIKLADDEIHRAYAEAKALLTPNGGELLSA